jgi:hypothetical protein
MISVSYNSTLTQLNEKAAKQCHQSNSWLSYTASSKAIPAVAKQDVTPEKKSIIDIVS